MKTLEYLLDSTNQKRHRQDPIIKKAWGYLFAWKGLVYDALGYYQPTLLMIHYNSQRKEVNPTWRKKSVMMWENAKKAEKIGNVNSR